MDSGGAVDRVRGRVFGCSTAIPPTNSIFWTTSVSAARKNGNVCGVIGLSRDWLPLWSWVRQRLGCDLSLPPHLIMAWLLSLDIDIDSSGGAALKLGHAYPATASCMNSILASTSSAAITRDGRVSFMIFPFLPIIAMQRNLLSDPRFLPPKKSHVRTKRT